MTACVGIQEVRQPVSDLVMAMKTALTEPVHSKKRKRTEYLLNAFFAIFFTPY
jgi:hypothetical protein